MRLLLYICSTASLVIIAAGCRKHQMNKEGIPPEIPVATISFSSPTPGMIFKNGDTVHIKAIAISTANYHGYDIVIHNAGERSGSYYFNHIHDHNDTLHISEKWKIQVPSTPTDLEAELSLVLDHEGHTKKGKVSFRVE